MPSRAKLSTPPCLHAGGLLALEAEELNLALALGAMGQQSSAASCSPGSEIPGVPAARAPLRARPPHPSPIPTKDLYGNVAETVSYMLLLRRRCFRQSVVLSPRRRRECKCS